MLLFVSVKIVYASSNASFNISVTVSSYTLKLLNVHGTEPYQSWDITVPLGGSITMVSNETIMLSLTGDLTTQLIISTYVSNSSSWEPVKPPPNQQELGQNEFVLTVDGLMSKPIGTEPLAMANPHVITTSFDYDPGYFLVGDHVWLVYSFRASTQYNNFDESIEVTIEASPYINE